MRVVSSFLPQNLITEIELYVDNSKKIKSKSWCNNSMWDNDIVKNSGLVAILTLPNFSKEIKNIFNSFDKKFDEYSINVLYYEWYRGSYIPWHNDGNHCCGATIYLNKSWDIEDGGIFMYYDDEDQKNLKCISPKYNNLIINENNEFHHVSLINYHSKETRKTLQIWFDKNSSKNLKVSYQ